MKFIEIEFKELCLFSFSPYSHYKTLNKSKLYDVSLVSPSQGHSYVKFWDIDFLYNFKDIFFNFTDNLMTYLQQTSGESFRRGLDWPAQQWPLGPYCPCNSPGWWCPGFVRLFVFLCGVYSPGRRLCCQWSVWWCPPSIPTTT